MRSRLLIATLVGLFSAATVLPGTALMAIVSVDFESFNNGLATMGYTYDTSFNPPKLMTAFIRNAGPNGSIHVTITDTTNGQVVYDKMKAVNDPVETTNLANRNVRMIDSPRHPGTWVLPTTGNGGPLDIQASFSVL